MDASKQRKSVTEDLSEVGIGPEESPNSELEKQDILDLPNCSDQDLPSCSDQDLPSCSYQDLPSCSCQNQPRFFYQNQPRFFYQNQPIFFYQNQPGFFYQNQPGCCYQNQPGCCYQNQPRCYLVENGFPVGHFYGSSRASSHFGFRLQQKEEKKPLPPELKPRILGPFDVWKVFQKQSEAIAYCKSVFPDCMAFSFKSKFSNNGQRQFLVAHPRKFWQTYKQIDLEDNHNYEIIMEGKPSKLYFHLGFYRQFNYLLDGAPMTSIFIQVIIANLKELLHVEATAANVMWLDSSTSEKYSCHLIFQLPNIALADNLSVGRFVNTVTKNIYNCLKIKETPESWPEVSALKKMFVKNKYGRFVPFWDTGVYSSNQNFRMLRSSNVNKKVPLLCSVHNRYRPGDGASTEEDYACCFFLDSLVTCFRGGFGELSVINFRSPDETVTSSEMINTSEQNFGFENTYEVVKAKESEAEEMPEFDPEGWEVQYALIMYRQHIYADVSEALAVPGMHPTGLINYESLLCADVKASPFPDIDGFITGLLEGLFPPGHIRNIFYISNKKKIAYFVGGNGFCGGIGRCHESNNVMLIVDVLSCTYYQKCYDPVCFAVGYRSPAMPLPLSIRKILEDAKKD